MENELVSKLKDKFNLLIFDPSEFKEKVKLASGGFGTVYKSKYKDQIIAMKDPNDDEKKLQLEKEITNVKGLRHIYIPKLYGITNSLSIKNSASLVIEYIKGQTFTSYLKYMPSQIEIITHLLDLVTTLEYLHKNGVIHRDLKPDNLMINFDSMSCILLDFGISKKTLHDTTNTVVVGTPLYMAPENFDIVFGTGASMRVDSIMKISPKVDVWALGVIINQVFSGEDPWAKYKGTDVSVLFLKGIRFPVSEKIKDDDIKQLISSCTEPLSFKRCSITFAKKQLMKILNKFCGKFHPEDIFNNYFEISKHKEKLCKLIPDSRLFNSEKN
jgi:serine/threonine protein kinase